MTDALVARYHERLTPEVAEETHALLAAAQARDGLVFGDRALCTVLRPRLVTPAQVAGLQRRIRPLMRAFRRAYDHAMADPAFRAQFGLLDWEEVLLADPAPYGWPSPTSRLDFFHVPGTGALALTEYNAETPAGAAYNDVLCRAFLDTPAVRAFARDHELLTYPSLPGVVGSILDAWRTFSGTRARPRIAILDWDDVPTRTEFALYRTHFAALGLEAVIDDPRRCEYRGGRLWVAGAPADVIYKRVLLSELVATCGLDHDVLRAVRARAVCLVNGVHGKVLHKKASLAVLSDEANAARFDAADLAAIRDTVPWTRVVRERRTVHDGTPIDLVPWILAHRERLVLKPNDEYGGKGITLGWTVDDATWAAAVATALAEPCIVQERVDVPAEPFAAWVDGAVQVHDRMLDTAPFVTHGDHMEGILTRLSTAALLNVTAGGGSTVPTLVVQPRESRP